MEKADMRWPIGIALGLAFVVAVNLFVVWIAVSNPIQVEQSYIRADR